MKHIDLFSGIGGFALAAERVWGKEYENVLFCDNDKFCQAVLKKNFGKEILIYGDIRELTANSYGAKQATDKRANIKAKGKVWRKQESNVSGGCNEFSIDLLTGGFPCQPFSQAGKRRGTADDRYLWDEMLRVIKDFKPRWIIGENVNGITNMAQQQGEVAMDSQADNDEENLESDTSNGVLWEIIKDLERVGYTVQPLVIPACAVGAPHRRDRIWIIAHSEGELRERSIRGGSSLGVPQAKVGDRDRSASNTESKRNRRGAGQERRDNKREMEPKESKGCPMGSKSERRAGISNASQPKGWESGIAPKQEGREDFERGSWERNWIEVAAEFCRVDDGLPVELDGLKLSKSRHRIERLKSLGNAIVPAVAEQIMRGIKEVENGK